MKRFRTYSARLSAISRPDDGHPDKVRCVECELPFKPTSRDAAPRRSMDGLKLIGFSGLERGQAPDGLVKGQYRGIKKLTPEVAPGQDDTDQYVYFCDNCKHRAAGMKLGSVYSI